MAWPRLRNLFDRRIARPATAPLPSVPSAVAPPHVMDDESSVWPVARLAVTDSLWGDGFQFPGGELETLRLARPLGLSAASSLLLVGAGSGGPPCCVATKLGAWVTGFEADAALATLANERSIRTALGRRAQTETWRPDAPDFGHGYYHHGLALETLREASPEPVLTAIATALKPGGQLTLVETVSGNVLDSQNSTAADWARLDHRNPASLPAEPAITRMLGRLGFEVRIVEDISDRYVQQALFGWRQLVGGLERMKLNPRRARPLVSEAELWLLQLRLFQQQALRRMRWHAIGRPGS